MTDVTANLQCALVDAFLDFLDSRNYGLCEDLHYLEVYSDTLSYQINPTTAVAVKYIDTTPVAPAIGGQVIADTIPPYPISYTPIDNAVNQELTVDLSIVFSENIQLGTGSLSLYKYSDNSLVTFYTASDPRISVSGATLNVDTGSLLEGNTQYYVLITSDFVADLAGNYWSGITNKNVWDFTTKNPNTVPYVTSISLTGQFYVGGTVTISSNYIDDDGDLEGSSSYGIYSYTDLAGTLGETLLTTSTSFVLTSSELNKTLRAKKTPVALTGASPGLQVTSAASQQVLGELAMWATTTKQTGFTMSLNTNSSTVVIDWGDGTTQSFSSATLTAVSKTYATAGTRTVNIHGTPSNIRGFACDNQQLTAVNIAKLTQITYFTVFTNSALTSLTNPTTHSATISTYGVSSTGITTLNLSMFTGLSGNVYYNNCNSLTSVTLPTSTINLTVNGYSCPVLAGTVNLSTLRLSGQQFLYSNPQVTGYTIGTQPNSLSFQVQSCNLTGTLNLGSVANITALNASSNPLLTAITFPASVTAAFTSMRVENTALTSLNMSGFNNMSSATIQFHTNPSFTTFTMPSAGTISNLSGYGTNVNTFSLTGANFTSTAIIDFQNVGWTSGEVDTFLAALDAKLGAGTGSIRLQSNAAPGAAGITARTSLIGKGWSVTTA